MINVVMYSVQNDKQIFKESKRTENVYTNKPEEKQIKKVKRTAN
jgi:hypothetical protein